MNALTNSSFWQSVMTIVGLVILFTTAVLTSLGCTALPNGNFDCTASTAPIWLIPYLAYIGAGTMGLKLVVSFVTGKFLTPTAPITNTGEPGTVTPAQVAATTKPSG